MFKLTNFTSSKRHNEINTVQERRASVIFFFLQAEYTLELVFIIYP